MNTTWKIIEIKRKPTTGLVIEVVYAIEAEYLSRTSRNVGVVTLTGDPNDPSFIPYESLTESDVISWVQTALGSTKISEIESEIQSRIQIAVDAANNPEYLTGLPWED